MMQDVARILRLSPEDRLREVAAVSRFVANTRRLDVAFAPSGTDGYGDLSRGAVRFAAFTVPILAASLEDIIRSKAAADRPQDRQDVPLLRAILRRQPGR
jgi:hypothetical protein